MSTDLIQQWYEKNASERDWVEDFPHENGMYQNKCIYCKESFIGYKRRCVCKICNKNIQENVKQNQKLVEEIKQCII